jgi:hypothetical protein
MEDEKPNPFDNEEDKKQDEKIANLRCQLIEAEMNKWMKFAFVEELLTTLVYAINTTHDDCANGAKIAKELLHRLEIGQIDTTSETFRTPESRQMFIDALRTGRKKIAENRDNLYAISQGLLDLEKKVRSDG